MLLPPEGLLLNGEATILCDEKFGREDERLKYGRG